MKLCILTARRTPNKLAHHPKRDQISRSQRWRLLSLPSTSLIETTIEIDGTKGISKGRASGRKRRETSAKMKTKGTKRIVEIGNVIIGVKVSEIRTETGAITGTNTKREMGLEPATEMITTGTASKDTVNATRVLIIRRMATKTITGPTRTSTRRIVAIGSNVPTRSITNKIINSSLSKTTNIRM